MYLKSLVVVFIDRLVGIWDYLASRSSLGLNVPTIENLLKKNANQLSADVISSEMKNAMIFGKREQLWDYCMTRANQNGLNLEFGVYKGASINYFSAKDKSLSFFGFDSFEGLQEDWVGTNNVAGYFNVNGKLPKVNDNVSLIAGWFENTLPVFLASNPEKIRILHLDSDTYESTIFVLRTTLNQLTPGTIILFDEFLGYHGWENGEYRAWHDFLKESTAINFDFIGVSFSQNVAQVALRIR